MATGRGPAGGRVGRKHTHSANGAARHANLLGAWGIFALFLFLLASPGAALKAGQYTDYTWESSYKMPQAPKPMALDCSFFITDPTRCASILALNGQIRDAVLLASIHSDAPDANQDMVRRWDAGLPIGEYYENVSMGVSRSSFSNGSYRGGAGGSLVTGASGGNETLTGANGSPNSTGMRLSFPDGAWGENGSLRNMWFRLLGLYPSVYDERDGYYYVSAQTLVQTSMRMTFVVPNPQNGTWCAQSYDIRGYDVALTKSIADYSTTGRILPISQLLTDGQKANLSMTMAAVGEYEYSLSSMKWANGTDVSASALNTTNVSDSSSGAPTCQLATSNHTLNALTLSQTYPIKRYPDILQYDNVVAIPPSGFAQGIVHVKLPSDFLSYTLHVKGYTYTVSRNDVRLARRGELYPVLQLQLIPAPGRSGTLHITGISETDKDGLYRAEIRYTLPIQTPDLGEGDCKFSLHTPFEIKELDKACQTTRSQGRIALQIIKTQDGAGLVSAQVSDPLGNPQPGIDVLFISGSEKWTMPTNAKGVAQVWIPQTPVVRQVEASISGTPDVAETSAMIFLPGLGQYAPGEKSLSDSVWGQAPILLILLLVGSLMIWLMRRRSSAVLVLLFALAMLLPLAHAQGSFSYNDSGTGLGDLQATISACQNYDFDNAVRHFGECAMSYQISSEFASMRSTAVVLIANIAPLVVATPDITPYKSAYQNMVLIALALFRVAWAFNSLYLILNIFNPTKRNEALKQYIWLIVFVIFTFFSFSIIREGINAVNSISSWIAGADAAATLTQTGLSAQFVAENYEMLKLVLPFLNITYLVLLARYVSVIAMMLFFPFSLLLFFTSATRGFGRAALTVTFAGLGLGVVNAILLLIYSILIKTTDPALSGTFAATFFSASFIIFFGFVNMLVLTVAFLSGIVFIGQTRGAEA